MLVEVVKAGRPNIGFVDCICLCRIGDWVEMGWVGRGETGRESVRGSIGRVRTGALILRDVKA